MFFCQFQSGIPTVWKGVLALTPTLDMRQDIEFYNRCNFIHGNCAFVSAIMCQNWKKKVFHHLLYHLAKHCGNTSKIHIQQYCTYLHNYFDYHVCLSFRPVSGFRHKIFFSLKSPWNHPLTPGVDHRGWPRVHPGHAAPPEELARARRALSSTNES